MNTKLLLSTVITGIITTSLVHAAPTTNKSSFYAGLNMGYGSTQANEKVTVSGSNDIDFGPYINTADKSRLTANGMIMTMTAGYNYIINNFTMGPELEFGYNNASDTAKNSTAKGMRKLQTKENFGAYGRVGYNFNTTLIYSKIGIKCQKMQYQASTNLDPFLSSSGSVKKSKFKSGFSLGGGIEAPLTNDVGIRLEFMHTRYSKTKFNITSPNPRVEAKLSYSIKPVTNACTAGLFIKI